MSAEKHQQLIDEGKLHPDGSIVQHCPVCGRALEQGEELPGAAGPGDAVAEAEAIVADAASPGQEG